MSGAARLAAISALVCGCIAHVPRSAETVEFLEPSTIAGTTAPHQPLEAHGAVHVLAYDGLDRPGLLEAGGFAWTASASLLAVARMWNLPSAPVLTPTYEARGKVQLVEVLRLGRDPTAAPGATARAPRALAALELGLGHRSNGQDGCALADHRRIPGQGNDFACVPLTDPPSSALNLHDGSFTMHYALANLRSKLLVPDARGGPVRASATAGAGVEWALPCRFDACMPAQMRARYGPVVLRWLAEGELVVLRDAHLDVPGLGAVPLDGSLRAAVAGRVHLGAARSPFGDFSATVSFVPRPPSGNGVGLFAAVHLGRDDLNIRFEERFDALIFGAIIDPVPIERIGAAAGP